MPESPTSPTPAERAMNAQPVRPHEHATPAGNNSDGNKPEATSSQALSSSEKTTEPEQAPERVKQSHVVEGGSPHLEIWLDPTIQKLVTERLINRLQVTETLGGKERPLTTIDRLIQKLGPEAIVRLEKGDLTKEDLAIAVFVLRDELLQKSLAAGKLVKDIKTIEPTRSGKLEKIPVLRRFTRTVENAPSLQTQLEASAKQLSTEYTRGIGFDQWTQDRIENDLVALNQLRTSVELFFYGRHLDDPLFDQDSISLYTAGRKTGNRLHDAVVDELMGTEGILTQRFGGKTFLELSQEDPIAATQALFEANQRALFSFAEEVGLNLLKDEKPGVKIQAITKQVDKLKQEPKPEELYPLANEKIKTAQAKLASVSKELEEIKQEIGKLETSQDYKTAELSEEANKRLEFLEKRKIEVLKNQLLTKADLESFQLDFNQALETHNAPKARIERQEKAAALDKWAMVTDSTKYENIIDTRFSQTFEDQFTLGRLASIDEKDGEIAGAERIREHIFWLIDKEGYDPALARKILSDEAIAKAIIWTYKLDARQITDLKTALPYLKSSQFKAGDLLRFMIHEGLKSAERGNPYLTLDEHYTKPKPELELEAESIYREGVGEVAMKGNRMVWEGKLDKAMDPLTFSKTTPQHYSVGLGIDRNLVNYNLDAKTDRGFLQLLPDTFDASLPDSVRVFYDDSGKLSTDKPGVPEWIRIYEGTSLTTEDALNSLNSMISVEFSELATSTVADYFLQRPQQEKMQMLRGFHTVENINDVALAEDPAELHNYQIRLDNNGNFFIRDVTDPDSPTEYELSAFFQKRLKDFKGSKLTLNQDERKTLQKEFLKILSPLGTEILSAQQRR